MTRLAAALLLGLAAPALAAPQAAIFSPGTMSSQRNDYNLSIADDGRTMVFARSEADFAKAKIMISERKPGAGRRWPEPHPISFSDDRFRDSDPWLTPDGLTLYFVSDRPTAAKPDKRDLDIWRSVKRNGRWQAPAHLGEVNGAGEELGPELHGGTLYFSTARKSGLGGLDIYAAAFAAGRFEEPRLLPAPINSPSSESDFTLSRDGKLALFWRQVGDRGLLHFSRRQADGAWSTPTPLPEGYNIGPFNFTPALSPDGKRLTFASTQARTGQQAGAADLYEAPFSASSVLPKHGAM